MRIIFTLNSQEEIFDFGTYALIMYYSKQLNEASTKKFLEATLTEYEYRVGYDLEEGNYTNDNKESHFITSEIQQVISFLGDELIPSLNNETTNLVTQYRGVKNFINKYYNNPGYLSFLGVTKDDFFEGSGEQLAYQLNYFKTFLEYAISINRPYSINIEQLDCEDICQCVGQYINKL